MGYGLLHNDAGGALHLELFLVRLSLDGPVALQDAHRVDQDGRPTCERVMRGLGVLRIK